MSKQDEATARANAYHDAHGACWTVIEYAGYERENPTGLLAASYREATQWKGAHYAPGEAEEMHVDIARWDRAGEFWTYDY